MIMKPMSIRRSMRLVSAACFLTILAACGGSDSEETILAEEEPAPTPPPPPVTQTFEVSVVNLTAAQPFSPIAVIAHTEAYSVFSVGEPATEELEILAEGGSNAELIAAADGDSAVVMTAAADSPLPPGGSTNMSLTVEEGQLPGLLVSMTTMLVNTNDAITAALNVSPEGMEIGDRMVLTTISYDAGTEANTEAMGTMPGPADNGEGFNAVRDDLADQVTRHSGVITVDDGLADSRLTEVHRWDDPVARIVISRTE